MSRSYRKPYSACTGVRSAADDKRVARRSDRRLQNRALREHAFAKLDWDEFTISVRYEAPYNDVWSWTRDGKQRIEFEPRWQDCLFWFYGRYSHWTEEEAQKFAEEDFEQRKQYYARIQRK